MIHEIKICNIGSFQEEATLSLIATDYGKKLGGVIVREVFSPILNSCVIYGANSSGKTQFIRALYDFQSQLRGNRYWEGSMNLQRLYNPYKLILQPSNSHQSWRLDLIIMMLSIVIKLSMIAMFIEVKL